MQMAFNIRKICVTCLLVIGSLAFNYSAHADGTVTVKTDPEGIEVWIDDQFIGNSPITDKKMKPGKYTVKLIDPIQHSSTVEEIFISNGESTIIEKTIKSKFGRLKLNTEPEGAQVLISTDLGKTPVSNDFMNPGKYRMELRYPNKKYPPVVFDTIIPQGETINITKTLQKEKAFDKKDLARLALGVGTLGCFILAIVEQGIYKENKTLYQNQPPGSTTDPNTYKKKYNNAATLRTIGIIGGSICLTGLEIVAFF
jgi:hypothetical protein